MNRFQSAVDAVRAYFVKERANMQMRADEDGDLDEHETRRLRELQDSIDVAANIAADLANASTRDEALVRVAMFRASFPTMDRDMDGEILACIMAKDAVWQLA